VNDHSGRSLRVVFAGTPEFSTPALRALLDSPHQICAVYTQPDRPAGRGRKLTTSAVKQVAMAHAIPVYQPLSLKDPAAQQTLQMMHADLMVVVAYGLMLPAAILAAPRLGCINIHASLLPRWRGAAPIQRAVQAGDTLTGVTIMQMNAGLDTGDIILQRSCPVLPDDTAATLHERLAALGALTLLAALATMQEGRMTSTPQDEQLACYAAKLSKQEAQLDWSQSAAVLERQVRAFNPWPVAQTLLCASRETIRIWAAEVLAEHTDDAPGTLLRATPRGVDVATGEGVLRLTRLQQSGGRVLSVSDFLRAHPLQRQMLGTYGDSQNQQ
jgi:methionyl-tRNA formyltransferase